MTDDLTPDPVDGFERDLGARLRAAADSVDGEGITRAGVTASVERQRRRRSRTRGFAVAAAAAVAVLGGIAVATQTGSGPQDVQTGATTTVPGPCAAGSIDDPAGWFRLSAHQAAVLVAAGTITSVEASQREEHAVSLTYRELEVFDDGDQDLGKQLFQLGYEDAAGIEYLRSQGLLTPRQEASVADGLAPVLLASQVDALFAHFPDLVAVPVGGHPFGSVVAGAGSGYETGTAAPEDAGTWASDTTTTALSFGSGEEPTTTVVDPCAAAAPASADPGPRVAPSTTSTTSAPPSSETTTTT